MGDIVSHLMGYDRLVDDVQGVLKTLVSQELEVQTRQGAWYLMRIDPYRTLEYVIEGAVITFVDITGHKQMEDALREARAYSEVIVDTLREPLIVLDRDLRVVSANRAFYRHFRATRAATEGQPFRTLGDGQWGIPALLDVLAEIRSAGTRCDDFQVTHDFPGIGVRTIALNARRLNPGPGADGAILIAMEDLTERIGSADNGDPGLPERGGGPHGRSD